MEKYFDTIFEKLYSNEESLLWYKGRDYVMSHSLYYKERGFSNVVFDEVTKETLVVARQIALLAHYTNFNEKTGKNRSIISFYNSKPYKIESIQDVRPKMKDIFGNLFDYCLFSFDDGKPENEKYQDSQNNDWLPLDIEFRFYPHELSLSDENLQNRKDYHLLRDEELEARKENFILASEVKSFFHKWEKYPSRIDITKGMLVNMVYTTGSTIDNLPACDNDNVARYDTALKVYCYKLKKEHIKEVWDENAKMDENGIYNEVDVKNLLSSIFCADCFESRLNSILDISKKSLKEYLMCDFKDVMKSINKNINALAYCEHNRWNVEKLIMGFSPLGSKDRFELECIFGKERRDKIKDFKKKKMHIDLCSNIDLKRVNPTDVKYDYFLMLAMPQILQLYYNE